MKSKFYILSGTIILLFLSCLNSDEKKHVAEADTDKKVEMQAVESNNSEIGRAHV